MNATREEKIKELRAELNYRRWVYAKQVRAGKMTVAESSRKIRIMQDILDDYLREGDLFSVKEEPQWNR